MIKGLVSIIILSYNQVEYTKQCLDSIKCYTQDVPHEIIIVDNASEKETLLFLKSLKDVKLIMNTQNKGFAGGCNQGIEAANGQFIMLLNNDTIVTEKWLFNMVNCLDEKPEISMVGPLTNATVGKQMIDVPYGDDLIQMQQFAKEIANGPAKKWRTLRLVAFCILIRRSLIDEIGLLDTRFEIGNYEDDDFNIRALNAGKKSYICKNSFIHHFMNISFKQKDIQREQIMMNNKVKLEDKWDNLDWNHHAVYNKNMLNRVLEQKGKTILHLGCGLGALAMELKENNPDCRIVGVENHQIRKKVSSMFLNEVYPWDINFEFLKRFNHLEFDSIIIEGMLELSGMELLKKAMPFLKDNGLMILRVLNARHVTTLERTMVGKVGGNLLCASSPGFHHFFYGDISKDLENLGYWVNEEIKVRKSLSNFQEELLQQLKKHSADCEEASIYNRIYVMKKLNRYKRG